MTTDQEIISTLKAGAMTMERLCVAVSSSITGRWRPDLVKAAVKRLIRRGWIYESGFVSESDPTPLLHTVDGRGDRKGGYVEAPKPRSNATPTGICNNCKGTDLWDSKYKVNVCRACHPPVPGVEVAKS